MDERRVPEVGDAFSQFVGLRMILGSAESGLVHGLRMERLRISTMYAETTDLPMSQAELIENHESYYQSQVNLVRIMTFLVGYATLDWAMRDAAKTALKSFGMPFQIADFAGSGVVQSRTILIRVGIGFAFLNDEKWERLKKLGELRNIFVHRMGVVLGPEDDARAAILIKSLEGLSLDPTKYSDISHFWLSEKFIERAIGLFEEIVLELRERFRELLEPF